MNPICSSSNVEASQYQAPSYMNSVGALSTQLQKLVYNQNIDELTKFLDELEPDIKEIILNLPITQSGSTILHAAVYKSTPEILKVLVKEGSSVERIGSDIFQFALECKVPKESFEVLLMGLDTKERKNLLNRENPDTKMTPLHVAMVHGADITLIQYLFKEGALLQIPISLRAGLLENCLTHPSFEDFYKIIIFGLSEHSREKLLNSIDDKSQTILHIAIQKNLKPEFISMLIKDGALIGETDHSGKTALHHAASVKDRSLAEKYLLLFLSILDPAYSQKLLILEDKLQQTVLAYACRNQLSPSCIQKLRKHGATLNLLNATKVKCSGWTVLQYAAISHAPIAECQELVEGMDREAQVEFANRRDNFGNTGLHAALMKGGQPHELVQFLLSIGSSVEIMDRGGRNALYYGALYSNAKVLELLLQYLDPALRIDARLQLLPLNLEYTKGRNILAEAVLKKRCTQIIKLLVKNGASSKGLKNFGITPLHFAAMTGASKQEFEKLLSDLTPKQRLAQLNTRCAIEGQTVLHTALERGLDADIIELLMINGAKNCTDGRGVSTLHYVNLRDGAEAIKIFNILLKGVSPSGRIQKMNQPDKKGKTLLQKILEINPDIKLINTAIELGSRADVTMDKGLSILHLCLDLQLPLEIFDLLLDSLGPICSKTVLNMYCKDFGTPLQYAIKNEPRPEIIRRFIEAGARVDLPIIFFEPSNTVRESIFHLAGMQKCKKEIFELLIFGIPPEKRVDVLNRNSVEGIKPLHVCLFNSLSPVIIRLLINSGARIDFSTTGMKEPENHETDREKSVLIANPFTLLFAVSKYSYSEFMEILELFVNSLNPEDLKEAINIQDFLGQTPLHYIFLRSNAFSGVLEILLKAGANPNIINAKGETPLYLAYRAKDYSAMQLLIQYGADPKLANHQDVTIEQPKILEISAKEAEQKWKEFIITADFESRIESAFHHNPNASGTALILQAKEDERKVLTRSVNSPINHSFQMLNQIASHYQNTRFKVVQDTENLLDTLEEIEGPISILILEAHGPGPNLESPSVVFIGENQSSKGILTLKNDRWLEVIKSKMAVDGTIIFISCGLGREELKGETNLCEELAMNLPGCTIIACNENLVPMDLIYSPNNPLEGRYINNEGIEMTSIFQTESRVNHFCYLEKELIEDYFEK